MSTMHPKYEIADARNTDSGSVKSYQHPFLFAGTHQQRFIQLQTLIKDWVHEGVGRSIIHFGDGDFNFLMRIQKGSAKPGNRGTLKPYGQIDSAPHRFGFLENDIIGLELQWWYRRRYALYFLLHQPLWNRNWWKLYHTDQSAGLRHLNYHNQLFWQCIVGPAYTLDLLYALISTRWIFKQFSGQIGLIGSGPKLELIKKLMSYPQYQEYLGTSEFVDYLEIPQKGAADAVDDLARTLGERIRHSKAKVFLFGVGHAKSGLIWQLKKQSSAVFIDVGVGIDAIAGCVCQERPYFADWINYRISGYDYEAIDQMDYNKDFWDKNKYKTINL